MNESSLSLRILNSSGRRSCTKFNSVKKCLPRLAHSMAAAILEVRWGTDQHKIKGGDSIPAKIIEDLNIVGAASILVAVGLDIVAGDMVDTQLFQVSDPSFSHRTQAQD
jgi:hypothetical protein